MSFLKKILLAVYNTVINFFLRIPLCISSWFNALVKAFRKPPRVMEIEETIDKILCDKLSIGRFGDGEIKLICGKDISFQKWNAELSAKLKQALFEKSDGFLPCIPNFFTSVDMLTESGSAHWITHLRQYRNAWYSHTSRNILYGNAFVSRFYLGYKDKSNAEKLFRKMQQIWNGRDIVFIEGNQSRMGVGNDLFDNAASIRRILVPTENAYQKYDQILAAAKEVADENTLFLLAVGATATVLAYDLYKLGCQAIDLGHLDIQYEWFLAGATQKVPVKNKMVNEARTYKENESELDPNDVYFKQIIAAID